VKQRWNMQQKNFLEFGEMVYCYDKFFTEQINAELPKNVHLNCRIERESLDE
jgi:hypothetical protein